MKNILTKFLKVIHVPLVTSAVINLAQDIMDDCILGVSSHEGKAVNVTMEASDMVLYSLILSFIIVLIASKAISMPIYFFIKSHSDFLPNSNAK
jgi:hypothetical protein